MTFEAWRDLVKAAFQGSPPSDNQLLIACKDGARSVMVRDVESDLALARSYENSFRSALVKNAGTRITTDVNAFVTSVRTLMPIDDDTTASDAILVNAIKSAYDSVNDIADKWDAYLLQAAIDLQRHVPFYQVRQTTSFLADSEGVTTEGFISRVPLPDTARIQQLWYGHYYAPLEPDVEYEADDIVISNARAYKVVTGGTLTVYDIGAGLTSTDGSDETLGELVFQYYLPERDWPVRKIDWNRRNQLLAGDVATGPSYAFPPQCDEIWLYPALDEDHRFDLEWVGVTEDFEDDDEVTFDKTAAEAAAHYIRAMLYQTELDDVKQAATSLALFQRAIRKAVVDNQARDTGSPPSVAPYDFRRRWRFCGVSGSSSGGTTPTDVNPNNYLQRTLLSPGELSIWSTAANMTTDLTVTGEAGEAVVILETEGHGYTLVAGDKMRVRTTLPETAGIIIPFRNGTVYGTSLLPDLVFPDGQYTTDGITTLASFDFVFNGTEWEYDTSRIPA